MSDRALRFAMTLSPDVLAIHLLDLEGPDAADDGSALKRQWRTDVDEPLRARGLRAPRLMLMSAPFREIHEPLLKLIARIDADTPGRSVAVLIPELVKRRWWERVLHQQRAERLRRMLVAHGGPRVNVIIAPYKP